MSKRTIARRRKAAGLVQSRPKSNLNESFFENWSGELAWLIGLIWSDGCLSGNTIDISSKDFQLIDLVLSLTDGRYALKNRGAHLRIHFTSKKVCDFLRSIGLTERKSLTIGWPTIPDMYSADFVRGLIDGDGCVHVKKLRSGQQAPDLSVQLVTASPYLRDGVSNWLRSNDIRFSLSVRQNKNPLWRFAVVHQDSLRKLYHLLYHCEDVPCLYRKRIPYMEWIETPRIRSGAPKRLPVQKCIVCEKIFDSPQRITCNETCERILRDGHRTSPREGVCVICHSVFPLSPKQAYAKAKTCNREVCRHAYLSQIRRGNPKYAKKKLQVM